MDKWLPEASTFTDEVSKVSEGENMTGTQMTTVASQPPIDMDHLAIFTDGDPEEEKELFELFLEQASLSLEELHSALGSPDPEVWRKAAHKFKGSAANLGAGALATLCKQAETDCTSDESAKATMLESITGELSTVRDFMQQRMAS